MLDPALLECNSDVVANLKKQARSRRRSQYPTASFTGIIPESTKKKLEAAKGAFKSVYVLAVIPTWEAKERAVPQPHRAVDPILVGFDGHQLRVIDTFDLTPLEDYVRREFGV